VTQRFDPGAWRPPPAPRLEGRYAVNHALEGVERWPLPDGVGPEDVAVDADGRVCTGVEDGRILRYPPGGGRPEVLADTGGRPLGVELDGEGRLVVCDAERGLLRLEPDAGRVTSLVEAFAGARLRFTNNAAVAADGTIYFTDSSTRFGLGDYVSDLLEHRPNGRLLAHDPGSGRTRLVADRLWFANGVALSHEESFVVVAETGRYRLTRVWLTGDRAGRREVLVDNLPGFPDNVSGNGRGVFWVAIASPRDRLADALLPRPRLRTVLHRLPDALTPTMKRYGLVLGVDEDGQVVHALHGPSGAYAPVTGAREHDGWLYLGSLEMDAVGRVPAPTG
jgi:sugar lactone lactonase YvrE